MAEQQLSCQSSTVGALTDWADWEPSVLFIALATLYELAV